MAEYIEIKHDKLTARIAPNNGGMAAQLIFDGIEVFMYDDSVIETMPMSAGAPVLFPFPSKTKGDAYILDGCEYYMPMHGLVKNGTFVLKDRAPDSVTLWCDSSSSQRLANYPFDYVLELEYRACGNSFFSTARVTNKSAKPMPHYLGWHPYFKATDKSALKFEHSMTKHYNYYDCIDEPAVLDMDLGKSWDNVFHTPEKKEFSLINKPDGYRARYILDDAHNVLVVCTTVDGAVCLEPWCGLPDSINNSRFVKYVQPGMTESYTVELEVEKIMEEAEIHR